MKNMWHVHLTSGEVLPVVAPNRSDVLVEVEATNGIKRDEITRIQNVGNAAELVKFDKVAA